MLRVFLIGIIACGLVVGGFLLFLYSIQRRFIYFPTHRDVGAVGGAGFWPWVTPDGAFLGYVKPAPNAKRVVIFFHGNGGEALDRSWFSEVFSDNDDVALYLPEYPGYGPRPGEPTEPALLQAAEQAFEKARAEHNVPITVVGESLGSAVAVHVASKKPAERLALISPLTSTLEVAKLHYGFLPLGLMLRDKFESVRWIAGVKQPLHIIHGTMDEVVPHSLGKRLYEAAQSPKQMTDIPGYGHNNIASAVTDSPFAEGFRKFVRGE